MSEPGKWSKEWVEKQSISYITRVIVGCNLEAYQKCLELDKANMTQSQYNEARAKAYSEASAKIKEEFSALTTDVQKIVEATKSHSSPSPKPSPGKVTKKKTKKKA